MRRPILLAVPFLFPGFPDASPACAQSAAKRPEFEVASIRLSKDCDSRAGGGSSGADRWAMQCRPLRWYIELAYAAYDGPRQRWPRPEVLGGPRWVDSEMYDISAKAESATPHWQMASVMLQALLEERFNLRVHKETRPTSVYALTVVREEARLRRSGCTPVDPSTAPGETRNPQAIRALIESGEAPCGSGRFRPDGMNVIADWYGMSMNEFAGYGLPARVGRPVVDRTGLTGLFDIHLEYSSDNERRPATDITPPASATGQMPSIFTALEEQLGLKLRPDRAPVEVIVIDHAERPSEN